MTNTEMSGPAPRPTRQRRAISEVLERKDEFLSAQQIHDVLRAEGSNVGLSTVYRTLQAMAEAATVDTLRTEAGESVYRACSAEHHHHLVCRACGATVEVAGPAVERWTRAVAAEHGFAEVSHSLELFGLCPQCGN